MRQPRDRSIAARAEGRILLFVILSLSFLAGCSGTSDSKYSLRSFSAVCREKGMGSIGGYTRDSAVSLAGRYARLSSEQGTLPGQDAECRLFRVIDPVCIEPSTFSSEFVVTDYSEAVFRDPGYLDLRFSNGEKVRFCFNRLVYRLVGDSTDEGGCATDFQGLDAWISARKSQCGEESRK